MTTEFDWDDGNDGHATAHGVSPEEMEEVYLDPRRVGLQTFEVNGEMRWTIVGRTQSRRFLFLVYTKRGHKIRLITARNADRSEKKHYKGK
ncbi:MAG TPA: BrnT family toxin [Chloroflexota bacterium]|nr:BrnT family toxin [Chloroflexota bacterium]